MTDTHIETTIPLEYKWSVAIFAARESVEELLKTVRSVISAALQPTIIDVLVNGNSTLAKELKEIIENEESPQFITNLTALRIWFIRQGGKAHAWNQYVHVIWPQSEICFFVDGYALPSTDAFGKLAACIPKNPEALAFTGTPSSGRTAKKLATKMLREGGLHGNLFALSKRTIFDIRSERFLLPLGLYSFDTVLGAVFSFGLDPRNNHWDAKGRIFVAPDVTWNTKEKKWWSYSDVKTQIKRYMNIAQRVLEREATKYYLQECKLPLGELPKTVADYVGRWMLECPKSAGKILWRSPFSRLALRKIRRSTDWSLARHPPEPIYVSRPI